MIVPLLWEVADFALNKAVEHILNRTPFPIFQIAVFPADSKAAIDLEVKQCFHLFLREGIGYAV